MTYEEHYANKQNCFDDILVARQGWGHSLESDQQIHKTLGLMLFYCPKEIKYIVEATFFELARRMELCLFNDQYDNQDEGG